MKKEFVLTVECPEEFGDQQESIVIEKLESALYRAGYSMFDIVPQKCTSGTKTRADVLREKSDEDLALWLLKTQLVAIKAALDEFGINEYTLPNFDDPENEFIKK